jgi:hypothetical protein
MSIQSSYILDSTHIWLVIHLQADGTVFAVEDHDHYAGGHVTPNSNETHEQLFIRRALARGFSQDKVDAFLKESKERQLKINS